MPRIQVVVPKKTTGGGGQSGGNSSGTRHSNNMGIQVIIPNGGGGTSNSTPSENMGIQVLDPTSPEIQAQRKKEVDTLREKYSNRSVDRNNEITARKSGGVQVGSGDSARTYIGKAIIPERGISANEYQKQIRAKLVREGQIEQKNIRKYDITEEVYPRTETREYIPAEQRESKLRKDYTYPIEAIDNKKMNTYSRDWKAFVTPSRSGGTATFTQPTFGELRAIQEQEKLSKVNQFIFGGEKVSDSLLLSRTSDLQKRYSGQVRTNEKIDTLSNELDKLSEGKVTDNTWTGTDEEYNKYQIKQREYNREIERQKTYGDSVKVGAFGLFLDTPIQNIRAANPQNEFNPITQFVSLTGETASGIIGGGFKKIPKQDIKLEEGFYSTKVRGTIQYDNFGKPINTKQEYFLERNYKDISGEGVGRMVGGVVPYLNPAGEFIFFGEQFERFGNVVRRSPNKNILNQGIEFYQESPVETIMVGGLAGFKVLKGTKDFAFTNRDRILLEPLKKKIPTQAQISMNPNEVIGITDKSMSVSRKFTGKGIAEEVTQGSRRYISTRFQDWFGLKPTYSGKYTGDILIKDTMFGNKKVLTISSKEAKINYKKVKENLIKKGFTEQQAKDYLARTSAKRTGYATSFGGEILVGEGSPLIMIQGERLSKGLKETIYLNPTKRIQIESPTRLGKLKQEEVSSLLEEFKTKTPKGKEEGSVGEVSFFRGSSEEYVPVKTKTFNEGAVAKKTSEETFDLGKIETYKTGEISKETTYLKPSKVSGSQSETLVINPTIQKETIFDLVSGTKTIKVKPIKKSGDLTISAEEWITISEEQLPIKLEGKSNIIKPAKIEKTPMSKTFGSQSEKIVDKIDDTIELYHVTNKENVNKILDEGLLPSKVTGKQGVVGTSDRVFTTFSKKVAENYNKMIGGEGEILSINVPKKNFFEAVKEDATKRTGLGQNAQVTFEKVPKEWIRKEQIIKEVPMVNIEATKQITGQTTKQILERTPKITEKEIGKVASDVSNILKSNKVKPKVLIESNYPRMVGGTGVVESSFIGSSVGGSQVTFEEVSEITRPEVKMNVLSNVQNKEQNKIRNEFKVDTGQESRFKLNLGVENKSNNKFKEQFKENEMLKNELKTNQIQQQTQKTIQRITQKITQKTKQEINKVPPKKTIKIIPPLSLSKRLLNKVQEKSDIFEAFVTKGKKEVSLGKKQTQQGAELLLKGKLISGLSASGFIKKGESKLKAKELKSFGTREFRPSKTNEFKIVELKQKRLRKSTTGKEIQAFRGNKIKRSIF